MLIQNELANLLASFNEKGIPVIVLKGAALLGSIYRDIGLRPMSDLDILVKHEHLDDAEAIAGSHGYKYVAERVVRKKDNVERRHLPNLIHNEKGIVLEIHQHIVDSDCPSHFDLSNFWAGARPVSILGVPALELAMEHQLIHLSINFLLDRYYTSRFAIGQLCDISEIIISEGESLNWDLVVGTAHEYLSGAVLHCVLYACQQLLNSQVPTSVLACLQPLEFDSSRAQSFLRRRVLDNKPWLAHRLVAPGSSYTLTRALLAAVGRIVPVPKKFSRKLGLREYSNHLCRKRAIEKLRRVIYAMLKPLEIKEDVMLDRWLHNLFSFTT
jgi:hypothetical protein